MYRQKRYEECIKEVKSKLKRAPNSLHLLNYHAMAYSALKRDNEALLSYQKIRNIDPTLAGPYYNMGIILKRNGRVEEAIESYKKAISLRSDYVQAYNNLGILYKDQEKYDDAIEMFTKVKELQPDHQNSYYSLALIKREQGLNEEAIKFFLRVLDLNPEHSGAKLNATQTCNEFGINLHNKYEYYKALKYFKTVIELAPSEYLGYFNTGNTYIELKDFKNAKAYLKKALKMEPKNEKVHANLGEVYRNQGEIKESFYCHNAAIKINPENPDNYYNIAALSNDVGLTDKAEENYKKAIALNPKHIGAHHNLALLYELRGQLKEALIVVKKGLECDMSHPELNYANGMISLKLGNFRKGWKNYDYRWKVAPHNKVIWPFLDKPLWRGEREKHVALWREQGIGDEIIFLSLIQEIKESCATLSVYVDPRLQSLCRRAMPDVNFVKDIEALQSVQCEYHLPIQSLGGLVRNDINDFDSTVRGYLKADLKRVESIRDELKLDGKKAIGISWKSFKTKYKTKSVQLKDLERIFSGLDVVLVNLQYGDVMDEIREFKEATGIDIIQCASVDNREDLDGLAALIEACDLVVSTSNVTVHLAGALAKKTWVMLNFVSIYYWLSDRPDSIWYPSVSLYRQPRLNDWDSVFASIRADMERELSN